MRHKLSRALLTAFLPFWLTTSAWAGYYEGWTAYKWDDYATALKEFLPLAKGGDADAQYNLGVIYNNGGLGVLRDYTEAAIWYRLAAEQGAPNSMFALGIMYFEGKGIPQDHIQAHMWLNLAAAKGYEDARKARDIVAKQMGSAALTKAQRLAREWFEEHEE